eukprot:8804252-Lingulodinium_polyedra.AAC.1
MTAWRGRRSSRPRSRASASVSSFVSWPQALQLRCPRPGSGRLRQRPICYAQRSMTCGVARARRE